MMMDTRQRVELVKRRTWQICRKREKHLIRRLSLLSVALCCCLIYAAWDFLGNSSGMVQGFSGATMLLENAGGYVLVGIVCFITAVFITVFCLREREKSNKQEKDEIGREKQ